jgi:hypothetical protein
MNESGNCNILTTLTRVTIQYVAMYSVHLKHTGKYMHHLLQHV